MRREVSAITEGAVANPLVAPTCARPSHIHESKKIYRWMLITENKISRTLKIFQKIPWPDCNDFLVERDQNALSLRFPFGGLRRPRPIPSSHRSRSPPLPQEILYKKFAIRDREIPGILYHQAASEPVAFPELARMLSPTGSGVFITECCGPPNSAASIFLTGYRL